MLRVWRVPSATSLMTVCLYILLPKPSLIVLIVSKEPKSVPQTPLLLIPLRQMFKTRVLTCTVFEDKEKYV